MPTRRATYVPHSQLRSTEFCGHRDASTTMIYTYVLRHTATGSCYSTRPNLPAIDIDGWADATPSVNLGDNSAKAARS